MIVRNIWTATVRQLRVWGGISLISLMVSITYCELLRTSFPPSENNPEELGMGMVSVESPGDEETSPEILMEEETKEPAAFSRPQLVTYLAYQIEKGDTISEIAQRFGLNQDTLLSFNEIKNSRLLQIGQFIKIPNQDGILHTVKKGDSLSSLAKTYSVAEETLKIVNGRSSDELQAGERLFIPGARLSSVTIQEINGDLFSWPVRGYISSYYGWRTSPFTGSRQFHSGLDISAPEGTPVRAPMAGRVQATGYDANSGNYIVIAHHGGYKTLYAHLSVIRVKVGEYVKLGDRIGDVGSTGLSTGSHLHFTVYKNGVTVNPRSLLR